MKIYLYLSSQVKIFYLPQSVSGSFSFDIDDTDTPSLINVDAKDGKWCLFSAADSTLIDGNRIVEETELQVNHFYVFTRNKINYLIYATDIDENNYVNTYNYSDGFELIFDDNNANVSYNCPYIKNISFSIVAENGNAPIIKIKSANLYVNKLQIKGNYVIKSGDEVELYGARILFINKMIIVIAAPEVLSINSASTKLAMVKINADNNFKNIDIVDKPLYEETDFFSKSPRLRRVVEEKEIEFSQPPSPQTGGEMPFILTIGPMLTMAVTSTVMIMDVVSKLMQGLVELSNSITQLVSGGAMLLSSLLWPLVTKTYNKRVKKRNEEKTIEKYNKYLEDKEKELIAEAKLQTEIIKENVISLDVCIENLKHKKLNFWDKRIDQNDFLVARIGVGSEKLKVKITEPEKGFSVDDSEIKEKAYALVEKYKYIDNVPIGYSFYENSITAIMGSSEKSHNFVNNILFQLLTFYSYDDLKVVVFTNEVNEPYWDYIKYLNHNMTNNNSFRFFASNEENAEAVIDVLSQEINGRAEAISGSGASQLYKPYYLIIVDDLDLLRKNNIVEKLSEIKTNIGFSSIIIENKLSKLPSLCNNFISLGDVNSGVLKNSYEEQEQQLFKDEINPNINMMEVAKILSNIPIDIPTGDSSSGDLPEAITFLEMAKVGKVEQLNIMNRWNTNDSTSNLKAEVGVDPEGKLMYLDLHEKAHGPHGLIAGMTGSGKSEFIITWILSLCMNFSPEDVAFILIDYKGGGLAFAFENKLTGIRLPHLTGTITNLDKAEIDRTLVSIDSEVKRRQQIFNDARNKLGESTIDIYKYQGFFHEGKLDEPLPHLFIVCDEFAELKSQQPDFMDNLISVARIGRSLGVHLILATQKPSGVVNEQIWSNTKFRVCLKVQDASDSREMLKRPDAASLKQTGRFYLQVGYDEYFALGQSGWCGAKYYPSDIIQKTVDKSVNIVDEVGSVIKNIQASSSQVKKGEAQGEQLGAIMKEIIKVAEQSNRFAKRLWLENIPEVITIDDTVKKYNFAPKENEFKVLIGEYDAPESQEQHALIYDFIEDGNVSFISRDSEENEEVVSSILYNVMKFYKPSQTVYYILDYGSQNFVKHKKSPFCGGVVTPADKEEYANLFKLLDEEKRNRKKILSESGVSYTDYVKNNPGKMPLMIVIFNNYETISDSDKNLYDNIGEFIRDSNRYGIVYMFCQNSILAIPGKFRQLISYNIAFKLKDVGDYSYCFNVSTKKQPKESFGRGICKNDALLHEFQTAFVCQDRTEENKIFVELFDKLNQQKYDPILKIPSLPEQVMLEDVKSKLKNTKHIPIGIEKSTLAIKSLDLTVDVGKTILSSKMKYLRYFVKNIITEIKSLNVNLIVIDPIKIYEDFGSQLKNYFSSDFDNKLEKINEFVQKNGTESETVIVFNCMSKFLNSLSDTAKVLELFENCKASEKCHILIADEVKKLKEFSSEKWYKLIDFSEGIFVGPGVDDQNLYKISTYSRELSQKMPLNYGVYVLEGSFSIVKLIEFDKIVEGDDDDDEE